MSAVRLEGVSKLYASAPRIRPPRPIRKPGTLTKRLTVRGALDAALANHPRRNTPSDSVLALDDVSLNVQEDSIFVVMGLSGSGKSTLLRCVNMLSRPTSGKVFLGEEDLTQASDDRLREIRGPRIAMVFQHHALLPHRTVLSNVSFGLELLGVRLEERNHRALQALNLVQLDGWGERYPHELSGGMRQRVGLARALTTDADVLLLDEPFSGLDPLTRRELQIDLLRLQDKALPPPEYERGRAVGC